MLTSLVTGLNLDDGFDACVLSCARKVLGRNGDALGRLLATCLDHRGFQGPSSAVHEDDGEQRREGGFV